MGSPFLDQVRAHVVDIRAVADARETAMLVDTNVLLFYYHDPEGLFESRDVSGERERRKSYLEFLEKCLSTRTELFVHKIALSEFAYNVEKVELRKLYEDLKHKFRMPSKFDRGKLKYEHPLECARVQKDVITYLAPIRTTFQLIGSLMSTDEFLTNAMIEWQDSFADPSDAMMISEAKLCGIECVLSDDHGFASFEDITLYTANNRVTLE